MIYYYVKKYIYRGNQEEILPTKTYILYSAYPSLDPPSLPASQNCKSFEEGYLQGWEEGYLQGWKDGYFQGWEEVYMQGPAGWLRMVTTYINPRIQIRRIRIRRIPGFGNRI